MKYLLSIFLTICVIACYIFSHGCNRAHTNTTVSSNTPTRTQDYNQEAMKVIIEGKGKFPQSLAGKWRADKGGWEFTFDSEGNITSAIINMGRQQILPGQTKEVPLKQDGKGIYKAGIWTVRYNPGERKLTVEVIMDQISLHMGQQSIEGDTTDILTGTVSEDGSTWHTQWYNYPEYIVTASDFAKLLDSDPKNNPIDVVIFEKIPQ